MRDLERHYRTVDLPRVRVDIQAFIEGMGNQGKCMRLRALHEQLEGAEEELKDRCRRYEQSRRQDQPYMDRALIAAFIPDVEARIEKLNRQIRGLVAEAEGRALKNRITDEMIERAREYPIESLIAGDGRRGNVLCIAHEERHPSMSLKGNRARCFSCGYYGDSIDVYQKLHVCGFAEAVKALQ
jgi:hypothetical protein